MYGGTRELTDEELANAIKIDPSQIAGMGPSLDALIAMLEDRKRKILERYETDAARADADALFREAASASTRGSRDDDDTDGGEPAPDRATGGKRGGRDRGRDGGKNRGKGGADGADGVAAKVRELREQMSRAVAREQIADLERLWYAAERLDRGLANSLLGVIDALGRKYEVEELASRYVFTGREGMSAERAIEVKEELETIDKLLEQLREARKNAKIGVVDLDELSRFVDEADVEKMREFGAKVEQYMREQAELQGLERDRTGNYGLSPKAVKLFQSRLLDEIFGDLQAGRSGRHRKAVAGEGVVELPKTRGYEFGDSPTHIDVTQTLVNSAVRGAARGRTAGSGEGGGPRVAAEDIEVHLTRNNPKCATCLLIDMSGSMRQMGQYVQCKRLALGMDALLRSEYPGDYLQCIELSTFARPKHVSEIPALLPMPVTTRESVVRLRVDMADPDVNENMVHPHFTNIQHGLELSRRFLAAQDTPNKQIILITDGLPTAHFENGPGTGVAGRGGSKARGSEAASTRAGGGRDSRYLYLLYPPDPLTERATMREAMACKREGITINIFLLPSWSQGEDDIAFAHRMAEQTGGRVAFTAGQDLDRYVLWDYVSHRRKIIG